MNEGRQTIKGGCNARSKELIAMSIIMYVRGDDNKKKGALEMISLIESNSQALIPNKFTLVFGNKIKSSGKNKGEKDSKREG